MLFLSGEACVVEYFVWKRNQFARLAFLILVCGIFFASFLTFDSTAMVFDTLATAASHAGPGEYFAAGQTLTKRE
eukprot:g54699.t1